MKYQEVYRMIKQAILKQADGPMSYVTGLGGGSAARMKNNGKAPTNFSNRGAVYSGLPAKINIPYAGEIPATSPIHKWKRQIDDNIKQNDWDAAFIDMTAPAKRIRGDYSYRGIDDDLQELRYRNKGARSLWKQPMPRTKININGVGGTVLQNPATAQKGYSRFERAFANQMLRVALAQAKPFNGQKGLNSHVKKMDDQQLQALIGRTRSVPETRAKVMDQTFDSAVNAKKQFNNFMQARNKVNESLRRDAQAAKDYAAQNATIGKNFSILPSNWVRSNKWFWQ